MHTTPLRLTKNSKVNIFDSFYLFSLQTHHLPFVAFLCLMSVTQSVALYGEFSADLVHKDSKDFWFMLPSQEKERERGNYIDNSEKIRREGQGGGGGKKQRKKEILIPKTIGIRKKRLCVRLRSGDKHHLRKSADRKHKSFRWAKRTPSWFVLFDLQIFSGGVYPSSATSRTISFFYFQ